MGSWGSELILVWEDDETDLMYKSDKPVKRSILEDLCELPEEVKD
jgi:hypothetical protein